jgi:hypothetical protein
MQTTQYTVEIEKLPLHNGALPPFSGDAGHQPSQSFATLMDAKPLLEQLVQEGYRLKVTGPKEIMNHDKVLAWLRGMSLRRPPLRKEDGAKFYGSVQPADGGRFLASCYAEQDNDSNVVVEQPEHFSCSTREEGLDWIERQSAARGFTNWRDMTSQNQNA